jgi:hypothetical protein
MRVFTLIIVFAMFSVYHTEAQVSVSENSVEIKFPVYVDSGDDNFDEFVYKRDIIKFLREHNGFPIFINTGNEVDDIARFNENLKIWYESNIVYFDILDLRDYESIRRFDSSCVKPLPIFDKNNMTDEEYEHKFQEWAAHHPDVPKLKGDDDLSKQKFEIETMEFRKLYYKK